MCLTEYRTKSRLATLEKELRETERKINNAVDLMIDTGSSSIKEKLKALEEDKERICFNISQTRLELKDKEISPDEVRRLFSLAKEQLKNGTLANKRVVIDQFIDKILIYHDRIEVYMNLNESFKINGTVKR